MRFRTGLGSRAVRYCDVLHIKDVFKSSSNSVGIIASLVLTVSVTLLSAARLSG